MKTRLLMSVSLALVTAALVNHEAFARAKVSAGQYRPMAQTSAYTTPKSAIKSSSAAYAYTPKPKKQVRIQITPNDLARHDADQLQAYAHIPGYGPKPGMNGAIQLKPKQGRYTSDAQAVYAARAKAERNQRLGYVSPGRVLANKSMKPGLWTRAKDLFSR